MPVPKENTKKIIQNCRQKCPETYTYSEGISKPDYCI